MRGLASRGFMAGAAVTALLIVAHPLPATAAAAGPRTTSCERWVSTGPAFQTGIFRECDHTADTGGSGALSVLPRSEILIINWQSGKSTMLSDPYITQSGTDESEQNDCPPTGEYQWHATVSADTTGSIGVGGSLMGEVCIDFSNSTSLNERYARVYFT